MLLISAVVQQADSVGTTPEAGNNVRSGRYGADKIRDQAQFSNRLSLCQTSSFEVHSDQLSSVPEADIEVVECALTLEF